MSTRTKWLLICLLFVFAHILFMTVIATSMYPGEHMRVIPFGEIDRGYALKMAFFEALASFLLVVGFAVSILRDET